MMGSSDRSGCRVSNYSRRQILLAASALLTGCSLPRRWSSGPAAPPPGPVVVRPPGASQWWRYAKRDGWSGKLLDVELDRIAEIDNTVIISRFSEGVPGQEDAIAKKWYQHAPRPPHELPPEVQQPWGQVLVDPHWDLVQAYATAIPLWPPELQAEGRQVFNVTYQTSTASGPMTWLQTMIARGWERIHVPAGDFTALRYTNDIVFEHTDYARWQSVRTETLWLAPEVGRWVARKSEGTYWGTPGPYPINEDSLRWELTEWA